MRVNNITDIIQRVGAIIIIYYIVVTIIPALVEATGSNITFTSVAFIILAIGVIASMLKEH